MIDGYPVFAPLVAAFTFSVSAALIRKASVVGLRPAIQMVLTTLASAAFAIPWDLAQRSGGFPDSWWAPALAASGFFFGQLFAVLTLSTGDSSILAPIMGTKVLIVAAIVSVVFREALPPRIWAAAVLATAGVAVISFSRASASAAHARTIATAIGSSICFAISDVMVAQFAPAMPDRAFAAAQFTVISAMMVPYVLFVVLRYPGAFRNLTAGRGAITLGTVLFAFQFALMLTALARFGDAARFNVLYSSRGVWSVVLLMVMNWFGAGHHMERARGPVVFRRFAGAMLLTVAVALAL